MFTGLLPKKASGVTDVTCSSLWSCLSCVIQAHPSDSLPGKTWIFISSLIMAAPECIVAQSKLGICPPDKQPPFESSETLRISWGGYDTVYKEATATRLNLDRRTWRQPSTSPQKWFPKTMMSHKSTLHFKQTQVTRGIFGPLDVFFSKFFLGFLNGKENLLDLESSLW